MDVALTSVVKYSYRRTQALFPCDGYTSGIPKSDTAPNLEVGFGTQAVSSHCQGSVVLLYLCL